MKHVVLDTCIYRKVPRLDSPEFKTFSYLCRKNCAKLHVPYVIEREFSTQLEHDQRKRLLNSTTSLKKAVNFGPIGEKSKELLPLLSFIESNLKELTIERSSAFLAWIGEIGALSLEESIGAWEAYFSGGYPLKEPKVRKDIPDSFIFQSVIRLHEEYGNDFVVVVEDGALRSACAASNIAVYSSLAQFLESPENQQCLAEKVIEDNLDQVLAQIEQLANDQEAEIVDAVESELLQRAGMLYGENLPGEGDEIYVSGVGEPYSIDVGDLEYLGAGVFIGYFSAKVELTYEFGLPIWETMELDRDKFHVEFVNDHYADVETNDEFEFIGRIEFDFGEEILGSTNASELIGALEGPIISADELADFQLSQEDI